MKTESDYAAIVFFINTSGATHVIPLYNVRGDDLQSIYNLTATAIDRFYERFGKIENPVFRSFWLGKDYWLANNAKITPYLNHGLLVVVHAPLINIGINDLTEYVKNDNLIRSWFDENYIERAIHIGLSDPT